MQAELSKVQARAATLDSNTSTVLNSLISRLEVLHDRLVSGSTTIHSALPGLQTAVQNGNARLNESVKELYGPLNKLGKTIDKKFSSDLTHVLPPIPDDATDPFQHMYFSSSEAQAQIDAVVADHLVRTNVDPEAIRAFVNEAGLEYPHETSATYSEMHRISKSIRDGDLWPALEWATSNRKALNNLSSSLEFALHRSHFLHCLLSDPLPPSLTSTIPSDLKPSARALHYARLYFQPFYTTSHLPELSRLLAASLYLPLSKLQTSPYADFLQPPISDHAYQLIPLFQHSFAQLKSLPLTPPLKTLTDIGGSGALARLAKVRSVMKEKKTGWSASEELPVEIPLWNEYRFHSVFACPVSKEQSREGSMMLPCGHVVAKESLVRLSKGGPNVKCPYCPLSSAVDKAMRVYF